TTQVLDDNALEHRRRHPGVPDALGVYDDAGAAGTDAEARRFTTLHAPRTEQQVFALEQLREQAIQHAAPAVRRAEPSRAHEHVAPVGVHVRPFERVAGHHTSWLLTGMRRREAGDGRRETEER